MRRTSGARFVRWFLRSLCDSSFLQRVAELSAPAEAPVAELYGKMREVADNVTGFLVSNAAHWIAEENPEAFTTCSLPFLTSAEPK
jgi:hypothetical protein